MAVSTATPAAPVAEATPSESESLDRLLQSLPSWPVTGEARVDIDGWIRQEFKNIVSAAETIEDVTRLELACKKLISLQREACVLNALSC